VEGRNSPSSIAGPRVRRSVAGDGGPSWSTQGSRHHGDGRDRCRRAAARLCTTDQCPSVFAYGGDAGADGLVKSIGRREGNVTGGALIGASLTAKRLEVMAARLVAPERPERGRSW